MIKTESLKMVCPECHCRKNFERATELPNPVIHGMLTIITLGGWGLIWAFLHFMAYTKRGPWICESCGEPRQL